MEAARHSAGHRLGHREQGRRLTLLLVVAAAVAVGLALGYAGGRRASRHGLPAIVIPAEPTPASLLGPIHPDIDPWRRTHPHAFLVPVTALQAIAQPHDLARVHRDPARVERTAAAIERSGLHTPLVVVYDQRRIVLEDGHNRLTGTTRTELPIELRRVTRITGYGVPQANFLSELAAAPT